MERVMKARVTRVENIIKVIQRDIAKIFIKLLAKGKRESIVAEEEAKYIEDYLHQVKDKIETWHFNLDHHDQLEGLLPLIKSEIPDPDDNYQVVDEIEERYSLRGRRSRSVVAESSSQNQNYQHDETEMEMEMDSYEPFTGPADDNSDDTDYENERAKKMKLAKSKKSNNPENSDGEIEFGNQHNKNLSAKTRINKFKSSTFDRDSSESYESEHQEIEMKGSFQSEQEVKNLDKTYKKVGDFFKCLICNTMSMKHYSTYADFEKHYEKVHNRVHTKADTNTGLKNPLKCKLDGCSQLLGSRKEMELHKKVDHSSCSICPAKFQTRDQLLSHFKEAHKSHMFQCKLCSSAFVRLKDFKYHFKMMHAKKNDSNSNTSELKWQDFTILPVAGETEEMGQNVGHYLATEMQNAEFHRYTQEIPDFDLYWAQLTCPVCRKICTRQDSLRKHIMTQHHPQKSKFLYKCSTCDKSYISLGPLKDHEKSHTTTYPCPEPNCNRIFNLEYTFKKHMQKRHGHLKCSFEKCDFHFTTQASYDLHVRNYHVDKVLCPICAKLIFKARLKDHNLNCHGKRTQFNCTFEGCSQVFNTEESFKVHYKDEHDPSLEPEFLCTECGVLKWTKSSLGHHFSSTHVRGRLLKFKCPYSCCKRTFSTQLNLSEHIKACDKALNPKKKTRKRKK